MNEYERTRNVTKSAQLADVNRPTARKYLKEQKTPAELQAKHTWRTRPDPLETVWPQAEAHLKEAPELEARALFEYLVEQNAGGLAEKHLRTFQRRVRQWRMQHGPDKEVYFPQDWPPGRAMQLDWTHANELGVTIQGQRYDHHPGEQAASYPGDGVVIILAPMGLEEDAVDLFEVDDASLVTDGFEQCAQAVVWSCRNGVGSVQWTQESKREPRVYDVAFENPGGGRIP